MFTTELQYIVIRYMLNELADEAANVGLIAVTNDPPRVITRFLPDPSVKSRKDVKIDQDDIARFEAFIQSKIVQQSAEIRNQPLTVSAFKILMEHGGNILRLALPRSVLTNDVDKEFDLLFDQLVSPKHTTRKSTKRLATTRDPLGGLKHEAVSALLRAIRQGYGRSLTRKVFARDYRVRGKTHRSVFDLAIIGEAVMGRREHYFQHVLVFPDAEESFSQAAALCWRWADVRAMNGKVRQLTAVLYGRGGQHTPASSSATSLLRREEIKVATIEQLPSLIKKLDRDGQLI